MSKYLDFTEQQKPNKKTVDVIVSNKHQYLLGVIKWKSSFRRYAFFPSEHTVFSDDCLQDIISEIKRLNGGRNVKS